MSAKPHDILKEMAKTFEERAKVYGDNYKHMGTIMRGMFPRGITLKTEDDFSRFHLFQLMVVKLSRLAQSNLTHQDSIHDTAVYAAIMESLEKEGFSTIHTQREIPYYDTKAKADLLQKAHDSSEEEVDNRPEHSSLAGFRL